MKIRKLVALGIVTMFSFLGLSPIYADTVTISKPPVISLTKVGGNIVAIPAIWSSAVSSQFNWLVDGKIIKNAKSKIFPSPIKKGTVVQFRESFGNLNVLSNKIVIGNIAVNGFPTVSYVRGSKTTLTVDSPKSMPAIKEVAYQWFNGPFEIPGANSKTYILATGDQGRDLSVTLKYSGKGFGPTTVTSESIRIPEIPRNYSLIWIDDFQTQTSLNKSIWKPENGDGTEYRNKGWGNRERQYYLDSQINFDGTNGATLNATKVGAEKFKCYYGSQCEWLSSKFVTKGLIGFKFGRIEVQLKGPIGEGSWGAFWMLGANIDERPWPGCGEIDIVELLGREPSTIYGTPHGPASGQSNTAVIENGFATAFHTYAIDWLPDQISWYLDGQLYGVLNKSSVTDPEHTWVFDHEYYLLMNLAMGGNFGGAIDPKLTYSNMSINWVKFSTINGIGELIKH